MADRTFKLKFLADIGQAVGQIDKLGDSFKTMSTKTKVAMGAGLAGGAAIGAATVAGLTSAIKVAASYEQAIGSVAAITQASAADQKRLFATGARIGKDTNFSAREAAQAMQLLAEAGVGVDDIVGGAADATVALAAATGKDLTVAASAASQALAIWKIPMKEMPDLINRAAGAALVGKFDVEDLSLAMGQGGGVAMSAGVSWQDFFTTIAAGSDLFTSGADAGTSYKSFIQSLTPNTKKARMAMQDLGLMTKAGTNLFYDNTGALKDGVAIAGMLSDATKDLTEEQRSLAFETLFGTDGSRTAIALARAGAKGYAAMSDTMMHTDAAAIAAQRMDNLVGAGERLAGAVESLQLKLTPLLGPLATLVDLLARGLGSIPTPVLAAGAAIGLFIGGLSALGFAALPIITIAGTLGLGIGAVALALLGIPLAIAAVITAGYLLFTHWDELKAKAAGVRDAILSTVGLDSGPAATPAKKGLNALGAGALAAIPIYGPLTNIIGGTKQLLGAGNNRTQMGALSPEGYATGGMVPGSGPRLAIVHGGEQVLTRAQQGGPSIVINNYIEGSIHSDAGLSRTMLRMLNDQRQRGALGF